MAPKIPQNNFAVNFSDNLIPPHPHRRMHILLSILAFLIVFGSITFYQMQKTGDQVKNTPVDTNELTQDQRDKVLVDLKESVSKSPPLTDTERNTILQELKQNLNQ